MALLGPERGQPGAGIFVTRKGVNTGRKRGGNSGHTICPPWLAIFGRLFLHIFWKPPKNVTYIVRECGGGTENLWTEKTVKHYKNRGFKTVLSWEWAWGAKKKKQAEPKRGFCTKIPPTQTTSYSGTLCKRVFWCFWGFPKKRPETSRNHYKNSGFGEISVTVSKGVFERDDSRGDLVPEAGGFGLAKPLSSHQWFGPEFP